MLTPLLHGAAGAASLRPVADPELSLPTEVLNKLHAYMNFFSPHYATAMARFIVIEDKVKGFWDGIVNLDFSPRPRKVANDALNRDTSNQDDLSAFERSGSRALMAGGIHPSTIFDDITSIDNRKGCAVGRFHNSQHGNA
jgi:hypothetical protein